MSIVVSLLLLALLFYGGIYISAAETAFFSLPEMRIKAYATDPDPKKQMIARMLRSPRDLLVTIFMINTAVNIEFQNLTSNMFGEEAGWGLKVVIPLILILVFGEIIPKYYGLQNNESLAYSKVNTLYLLQKLLAPLRRWIITITTPISRLMFFFLKREPPITREELEHIVQTSEKEGLVQKEEKDLIAGFFNLQQALVKDVMWPREDTLFYDIRQPLSKLIHIFMEEECSRLPVCDATLDHVLGMIDAGTYFQIQHQLKSSEDLRSYLTNPYYVPENMSAKTLLKRMYEQDLPIALAVDEYGTVVGLIALEDLIEVVIGEIQDSRDQSLFTSSSEKEIIASGKLELAELNTHFGTSLISPAHMVTIGGWLTEKVGDIPPTGKQYEFDGFLFKVLAATPNRVVRLFIRRLPDGK